MTRFAWVAALLAISPRLADAADYSAAAIALERDASASQRYAAEEICRYVEKATGRSPRIGGATAARTISIETAPRDSALGPDGFSIEEKGGTLVIRGSRERGCLYGAYELIERFLGVRWYSPDFEVVPRREAFEVPDGFSLEERPDFEMRMMEWYDVTRDGAFAAKLRLNAGSACDEKKFGGDAYRFGKGLGICHTFASLLGDEHFDAHPEYFSMVDGKRTKERSQLCLTNPEVLAIVTSNVLRRIRQDPDAAMYGVSQNDWYGYCTCPKCAAVDAEEESPAGTMLRFVNAIAEEVEKEFPNALVETLAYQYTRKPPKLTRPRRNVVVCLCTFECDLSHPIETGLSRENMFFRRDLREWGKIADRMFIWDYVANFAHYPATFPNWGVLQDNLRFFRSSGVKHVFELGAYQGAGADFADLKAWLIAKYMWKVDRDEKALLGDFFKGFYGSAADIVREDFEEAKGHCESHPMTTLFNSDGLKLAALPEQYFDRALARRKAALAAAEGDSEHAGNIRKWAYSIAYTRLFRLMSKMECLGALAEDERKLAGELARDIVSYGEGVKNLRMSEWTDRNASRKVFLGEAVKW